ncbi:MAG: UpxY family transcription antiterminator [Phycisphaerae bacterium]|nr:UpxY family transcription antiterminator [Phycisphaerae bacterium]
MLKAEDNPPLIWPAEKSIRDFVGTWWVAHTKSRNEKALAWQMQNKDISYFLPMHWKVAKKKGRTFRSLLPLFTGYVFFCGSDDDRLEVLRTNRVAGLIPVHNPEALVSDLLPIEILLLQGAPLQPHKYIKAGTRCRVIAGALMGMEGIVFRTARQTRLVLQVDMLGQATSVEVESDYIELID